MDFEYIEERIDKIKKSHVSELMASPAIIVDQDTPICKAGSMMLLRRIKQLPVLQHDHLVGMVTLSDVCKSLMEKAARV